jgi:hypothetical protein
MTALNEAERNRRAELIRDSRRRCGGHLSKNEPRNATQWPTHGRLVSPANGFDGGDPKICPMRSVVWNR